jgi:site-specific recombinase XerD
MAAMETKPLANPTDPSAWQQALYAFLAEKERRSGSQRTVEGYSRMLQRFFGVTGKTPDQVTSPEVLSWAHGIGLSGRVPSSVTIGARTACLSSFYKFLIRMGTLASNPCDALERPKVQPSPARGYTATDVQKILAAIPREVRGGQPDGKCGARAVSTLSAVLKPRISVGTPLMQRVGLGELNALVYHQA